MAMEEIETQSKRQDRGENHRDLFVWQESMRLLGVGLAFIEPERWAPRRTLSSAVREMHIALRQSLS